MISRNQPFFSVIIPVFNGEAFIAAALESVRAQTFADYEIVICDDGSTDRSAEIIRTYQEGHRYLQIKYIYQKNKGLGGARNTAMANAAGKVLALLDQDDRWYPHKLAEINKAFLANPEADYVGHDEVIMENGKPAGEVRALIYGHFGPGFDKRLFYERNYLSTSSSCFKRSVTDKVGYFSEDKKRLHFVEDYDYWLRMAYAGCHFFLMNKILGEYIIHEDNYSIGSALVMFEREMSILDQYWRHREKKTIYNRYRYRSRMAWIYLAMSLCHLKDRNWRGALPLGLRSLMTNPLMSFILLGRKLKQAVKTYAS